MKWTEESIVLSVAKFGESSLRVSVLAKTHGVYSGIVKFASKKRATFEIGNQLLTTWNARLSEHMGSFNAELITPFSAYVMHDKKKLSSLVLATNLAHHFLPERTPEQKVYKALEQFLIKLCGDTDWKKEQVIFELELLNSTGYGLDLTECAATGIRENLTYLSPKSGRAVSEEPGFPYKEKLFKLPGFFLDSSENANALEIENGLRITRFFLDRAAFELHKKPLLLHN